MDSSSGPLEWSPVRSSRVWSGDGAGRSRAALFCGREWHPVPRCSRRSLTSLPPPSATSSLYYSTALGSRPWRLGLRLKGCWVGAHFELVVLVDERLHLQARRYCRLHGRCAGLRAPFRRRRLLTLPRCVLPQVCVNPTQVCVNPTLGCVLTFCTSGDTSCSAPTPPRVRSTSRRGGLHAAEGAGEGGGAPAVSVRLSQLSPRVAPAARRGSRVGR